MEQLKRLAKAVEAIKFSETDILTSNPPRKSKLNTFYAGLINGSLDTDEEAATFFYQSTPSHSSYKSLKLQLRNRLVNTFFFWEPDDNYSKREQAYAFCIKYAAIGKLLISLRISTIGIELIKKVHKKAMTYEFPDYLMESSFYLRSYYVVNKPDHKQAIHYQQESLKYHRQLGHEIEAGNYLFTLMLPHVKQKSSSQDTFTKAQTFLSNLKPYLNAEASPRFHHIYYNIESIGYLSINDYKQTAQVCNRAIIYFEGKSYVYKTALSTFYKQLLVCHTQMKEFQEGKIIAEKSMQLQKAGTYGWFLNFSLYIMLSFHSRQYQKSYEILIRVLKNPKLKRMPSHLREKWQIYQMYVHFLVFAEKIKTTPGDSYFSTMKMGRFLNSVPTFSQDKRGLNIPILVIQILFMILKKDYDRAVDRIEAIEKYCSRYLKKDENFRSNCFIKMLLQIPISNFHRAGIQRRTAKYLELLKEAPLAISNQSYEIEILPYEDLWEILINALETKTYRPGKK